MVERGLTPIRVDVMSGKAMRIIDRLPEDLKNLLVINKQFDITGLPPIEPFLDL